MRKCIKRVNNKLSFFCFMLSFNCTKYICDIFNYNSTRVHSKKSKVTAHILCYFTLFSSCLPAIRICFVIFKDNLITRNFCLFFFFFVRSSLSSPSPMCVMFLCNIVASNLMHSAFLFRAILF